MLFDDRGQISNKCSYMADSRLTPARLCKNVRPKLNTLVSTRGLEHRVSTYLARIGAYQNQPNASTLDKLVKGCMHTLPFTDVIARHMAYHKRCDVHKSSVSADSVRRIAAYIRTVTVALAPQTYTILNLTAVVVSFLVTGYHVNDTRVFPKIRAIAAMAPRSMVLYGRIEGVQCRTMSNATRAVKALISATGHINPRFIFPP